MKVSVHCLTSAALPLHEEPLVRPTHWICGWMGPSADLYAAIHTGMGWGLASIDTQFVHKDSCKNAFSLNATVTAGQMF